MQPFNISTSVLLVRLSSVCAHKIRVDVHLGHVIDDHRDTSAFPIVQNAIEERRFPSAEKTGKDGDWKA